MKIEFRDGSKIELRGDYAYEDGIINCLPEYLQYETDPSDEAKNFIDIHNTVMRQNTGGATLLYDKVKMAKLQKEFYDTAAKLYQKMDDTDKAHGGIHWLRIRRNFDYDYKLLRKGNNLLYVGAGNCRLSLMFAERGVNVVSTDISRNILQVGKRIGDQCGVDMAYMAQNAELPLPFDDDTFDMSYSNCTANHVVDWKTYFGEKIRVLKPGGVLVERMPNSELGWFWDKQTVLNDAVEIKALKCNRDSVRATLRTFPDIDYKVWTHDRVYTIIPNSLPFKLWRKTMPKVFFGIMGEVYKFRAAAEDRRLDMDDGEGIYTLLRVVKKR